MMSKKLIGNLTDYIVERASGRKVLYVGAGDDHAELVPAVRRMISQCASWQGMDVDPRLAQKNPDRNIFTVDLNKPFEIAAKDVDLIIATEVLEHIHSPIQVLQRWGQLFPGVEFLGSVPNGLSIGRIISAMISPSKMYVNFDGQHTMVFNPLTLSNTLTAGGMKDFTLIPYEQRWWLRPVTRLRPEMASGYVIEGRLGGEK